MKNIKTNLHYDRCAPILIATLGVLSLISIGLGVKDSVHLSHEELVPTEQRYHPGPSTAQVVFYSTTAAVVSACYAPIDLFFYLRSPPRRRYILSLVGASIVSLAWMCQVAFWTNCEELNSENGGLDPWCPQRNMTNALRRELLTSPLQDAKFAFGWILTGAYLGYVVVCAVAVRDDRKLQNRRDVEETEDGKL